MLDTLKNKTTISDKIFAALAYFLVIFVHSVFPLAIILLRKRRKFVIFHCFQAFFLGIFSYFILFMSSLLVSLGEEVIESESVMNAIGFIAMPLEVMGLIVFLATICFGLAAFLGIKIKMPFIGKNLEKIIYEDNNVDKGELNKLPSIYKAAICYPLGLTSIFLYTSEKESKTVKFHSLQSVFLSSYWIFIELVLFVFAILVINNDFLITIIYCAIMIFAFSYLFIQWFMIRKTLNKEIYQLPLIGKQALKTISKQVD